MSPSAADPSLAPLTHLMEQGSIGAILVLAILAVIFLCRQNQALHTQAREDRVEMIRAITDGASAQHAVAKALEQSNALIQTYLFREASR